MSALRAAAGAAGVLAMSLAPAAALRAQIITAGAVIMAPRGSTRYGDAVERVNGRMVGAAVVLRSGCLSLSGSGTRGRLAPEVKSLAETVGEVSLTAHCDLSTWLGVESRYQVRAATSLAGYRRWETWGLGARVRRELGTPAAVVSAGLLYAPVARVFGVADPMLVLSGDVDLALAAPWIPLLVGLNYRTERYRFARAVGRSEQFDGITLMVGSGVRRERGRWTFRGLR